MIPQTRYAMVGELGVAFQTIGEGPPDLMWSAGGFNHVDEVWEDPSAALFLRRLAGFSRLTRFDLLGAGASDRIGADTAQPAFVEQLDAVCEAADTARLALFAMADAGPGAVEYAVADPDRVTHLILYNTSPRLRLDDGYPIGLDDEVADSLLDLVEQSWGTEMMAQAMLSPDGSGDPHSVGSMAKYMRSVGTPREMRRHFERFDGMDVRHLLGDIECPTLVLHRPNPYIPESHAQYLAERILEATYIQLPGPFGALWAGAPDLVLGHIEGFITDADVPPPHEKKLMALLFTDIVDSTARLEDLGDRDWSAVLFMHDEITARWVTQYRGSVVKSTGDGVLAMFANPADAVHAARAIRDELARMSIQLRSGIHYGEVQETDQDLLGVAVHIAARVVSHAEPGQILVSRTVRDLTSGSIPSYVDAGSHQLKGIGEPWQLYRLTPDP